MAICSVDQSFISQLFFQLLEEETKDNRVVGKNIALSEEELLRWKKLLLRIMFTVVYTVLEIFARAGALF